MLRELAEWANHSLRWLGHVEKIEDDRLVKRLVGSDVRGGRLREGHA